MVLVASLWAAVTITQCLTTSPPRGRFRSRRAAVVSYVTMAKAPVLTSRTDDFSRWYQDVIAKGELAEYGPVRGTMVIRPFGYSLWERMQAEVDSRIKATGARNAYFPLFIPDSYLKREAEHVKGFSPELAVVTHAGGKELDEPVVIRPTSETVIGEFMAKWVQSYRDLPLLLNQWSNVVRWELRPRLFLRTSEFLWQEGHTAHASYNDARDYARQILHDVYWDFMVNVLAMPVVVGRKSTKERFAGAINTLTAEAMMGDGKALQMGTSHELGQNFARVFDIRFSDSAGARQTAWTTSWGVSTRMIGGLIMVHGDDAGLRVPPRLASVQAVVLAVKKDAADRAAALAAELCAAGVRAEADLRTDSSFGRRTVDWELKGIPVRLEIGERELAEGKAVLVRRVAGSKAPVPLTDVVAAVNDALIADQLALFEEARARRDARIVDVFTIEDAVAAAKSGWARIPWKVLGHDGEDRLAAQAVSVRCLTRPDESVPESGDEPDLLAYVGRAY